MIRPGVASMLVLALVAACDRPPARPSEPPPAPTTLDEFKAAAAAVVKDTGVPGAGIALVRPGGIEWAGGFGVADREHQVPVTAETHFRAGSISKTFVAIALVQQYLDDKLDIDAPISELAPDVAIDNDFASPVTLIELLQHTAGFDDMHFNEMYNLHDPPDLPLARVLARNPASRRVRWRPGTRMSYSNPGYAVAAYVLERVTGRAYEDVIRDRIFAPLGMTTSSFRLDESDLPRLARGYDSRSGPPVPFTPIYLRPAGNLHTSPQELGTFVQLLLNWGETETELVIDPEYLSNMERPRTSLSARAGLIYGYGSGIASSSLAGFPVLGHGGGIDGFLSSYGYSAARDAGWVVLVNATYAPAAVNRLSELALRYLKKDVDPPKKPEFPANPGFLRGYAGYYHPQGTRNEILAGLEWLLGGSTLTADGNALVVQPVFGRRQRLIPTSDTLFRRDEDVTPSRVFTTDEDGRRLLLGDGYYGVRTSRWRVEIVRGPVVASLLFITTIPIAVFVWLVGPAIAARFGRPAPRAPGSSFVALKVSLALIPVACLCFAAIGLAPAREWGDPNAWTRLTFLSSGAVPLLSAVAMGLVAGAAVRGVRRWFLAYAAVVTLSGLCVSAYMAASGWIGLRLWAY
jgi:CubicO group peptidase (beta-lactamase class C family)